MSFNDRDVDWKEDASEAELHGQKNLEGDIREKVTHSEWLGCGIIGSVKGVHYGTWKSNPACLVLLQFTFRAKSGPLRLKRANVHLSFRSDPDPSSKSAEPWLYIFSPRKIYGTPYLEERKWAIEVGMQTSISAGPLSLLSLSGPHVKATQEVTLPKEQRLKIVGQPWSERRRQQPHQVLYSIEEAANLGYGIPDTLNVGIVVGYNGPFQATVEVSAKTGVGVPIFAPPWSKDDPLLFNTVTEKGTIPTKEFDKLDDVDWMRLVPYVEEWKVGCPKITERNLNLYANIAYQNVLVGIQIIYHGLRSHFEKSVITIEDGQHSSAQPLWCPRKLGNSTIPKMKTLVNRM